MPPTNNPLDKTEKPKNIITTIEEDIVFDTASEKTVFYENHLFLNKKTLDLNFERFGFEMNGKPYPLNLTDTEKYSCFPMQ
tara:strand:- start:7897 stop:8139 length:243 start_codon:yes stop_codon:yes gene_type:complete